MAAKVTGDGQDLKWRNEKVWNEDNRLGTTDSRRQLASATQTMVYGPWTIDHSLSSSLYNFLPSPLCISQFPASHWQTTQP
ncbi:hypothetical protein BUE76_06175 [Cnuella takakiae]|nr:hypothetical protein BUE76_06175 [Cnuella takakiae]